MNHFGYFAAVWLFSVGLYGIVTSRHLVHMAICLAVVQSSTYVLLLTIGYRSGATAPVFAGIPLDTPAVDPIVQALMLTDVVVEVTVMALILALVVQAYDRTGKLDPNELGIIRG